MLILYFFVSSFSLGMITMLLKRVKIRLRVFLIRFSFVQKARSGLESEREKESGANRKNFRLELILRGYEKENLRCE